MATKKILFLGRKISGVGYESPENYKTALPKYFGDDYEVFGAYFDDLIIDSAPNNVTITDVVNNVDLKTYDFVFMMGWFKDWKSQSLAVAEYLHHNKVRFLNKEALKQRSSSKISQAVIFGLNNIPIPRTISYPQDNQAAQDMIIKRHGLPFIYKEANGRKGINNYLVHSPEEFKEILAQHRGEAGRYIAQEYIDNDRDYRVLCANNKVYMIIERKGQEDSHLNNTSQGALATELPISFLSPELQAICVKSAQLLNRQFSGVDLIKDTKNDDYYVLEANNMPQMLSGVFPERKAEVLTQIIKDKISEKNVT
jgi:glutathione synthase/RimK-type ligase-like ATP-grasp enzyme